MNEANGLFEAPEDARPDDILKQLIGVFESTGWLNQKLRIQRGDRRCWLLCTHSQFLAYRINEHCHISPGIPGWPVCIVNHDVIIDDAHMSAFESTEPNAYDWVRCIVEGDFDII